jgi:hypothetical protein
MVTLRCTQKLLSKNPGAIANSADTLRPRLGDWHANLVRVAHLPIVLCVNDTSLLPVLLRGKDFPSLLSSFRDRLSHHLTRNGISVELVSAELAAMETIDIQPTNNRSVLSSMNDFVHHLRCAARDGFDITRLDELENKMARIPLRALQYQYPIEAASSVLNTPPTDNKA